MMSNIKIGKQIYPIQSDDGYLETVGSEFEPNMVSLFEEIIEHDAIVYDIGANIGLTAILFATLAKKVVAFEPSPSTYDFLKINVSHNNIQNVMSFNMGFGEKCENSTLTFAQNNRSGGFISNQKRPEKYHITETIELDTLDNFVAEHKCLTPSVLKIDVEGFEKNVIAGGMKVLAHYKPTVIMEMNHFCLNVLHRITIPEFIEYMCSIFPYLYAVDANNQDIKNLHDDFECYYVMHEHVVNNRFPNLVGGYSEKIVHQLNSLTRKHAKNILYKDNNKNTPVHQYLNTGWSSPEAEFVWTDGKVATLKFLLEESLLHHNLSILFKGFPFITSNVKKQDYSIIVNGTVVKEGFLHAQESIECYIPKTLNTTQELIFEFNFPKSSSPKSQGLSSDERMLGFALASIEVEVLESIS